MIDEVLNFNDKDKHCHLYLGIDPGWSGAIASLFSYNGKITIHKCPESIYAMTNLVRDLIKDFIMSCKDTKNKKLSTFAIIEDIHGRGYGNIGAVEWSAQTNFRFGMNCGAWEAVLHCNNIRFEKLYPQSWQHRMLGKFPKGKSKETSLAIAVERHPQIAKQIGKNHNFADAVNLAELCQNYFNGVQDETK